MTWNSGPQYRVPVGEQLAAEAAQFLDSVVIARLTADFPCWHIWRPPSVEGRRWGARRAGTVIITGTAEELRASLAGWGQEGRQ